MIKKLKSTSRATAKLIAGFAYDKKAEDIAILDMRQVVNFCDYFVILSASSDRRSLAIADAIDEGLNKLGIKIRYSRRQGNSLWILMDTGDVIVHIFAGETREFYGLEHLWQDAPRVAWKK